MSQHPQTTTEFFIGGKWIDPHSDERLDVLNPATEESICTVALADAEDVDLAVKAAREALPSFAEMSGDARADLIDRICDGLEANAERIAEIICDDVGAPIAMAERVHVGRSISQLRNAAAVARTYEFSKSYAGDTLIERQAVGTAGIISAWNWPLNLLVAKTASALAAGCTIVAKPGEVAPLSCLVFAEIVQEAGCPPGVFNLINGSGLLAGRALVTHSQIDIVSFTGSTAAGVDVAKNAASAIKPAILELGGKSPSVVLPPCDLGAAVRFTLERCFLNSGQSCQAPTRLIAPLSARDGVIAELRNAASDVLVGDPTDWDTTLGPVVSATQWERVQGHIADALDDGIEPLIGGLGRPDGFERGYFVRPTVFLDVPPDSRLAQNEVFGPVLAVSFYENEEEALAIANNTRYGLSSYVWSSDVARGRAFGRRIDAGRVYINGVDAPPGTPFGGFKESGIGREGGVFGLEEFLEVKAIIA